MYGTAAGPCPLTIQCGWKGVMEPDDWQTVEHRGMVNIENIAAYIDRDHMGE